MHGGQRISSGGDPTDLHSFEGATSPDRGRSGRIVGAMTRILLISGSAREGSLHTAALRTAARFAPPEITATLYGGLRGLPAFVPGEQPTPDAVTILRHQVGTADAVLFSTPEYAGSLPGGLKNLLDWLVDGGDLDGRPAAWLSVSAPGQDESARSMLETVLAHGRARLLRPACVRVPLRPEAVDAQGVVGDPQLHLALQDMLRALARSPVVRKPEPPSWQAYSSLYPVVTRNETPAFLKWRAQG
jgi:chromate reductase